MSSQSFLQTQPSSVAVLNYTKTPAIVVTGGAGYIGSHVVYLLLKAGFTPVVIDDLSTGDEGNLLTVNKAGKLLPIFKTDFTDSHTWETIFNKYDVNAVVHLAAKIDANESISKAEDYIEANFTKTQQLLEILHKYSINKLVFASTAAVYGNCKEVPITEDAQLLPLNPYGESKMLAEQSIAEESLNGLSAIILRFFNASGTLPELEILPKNPHGLLAKLMNVVSNKEAGFLIYGDIYKTEDGTCVRDMVSVVDIARAVVRSVEELVSLKSINLDAQVKVFNVGSEKGFSIKQIIQTVETVFNKKIPFKIVDPRQDEVPVSIADSTKIKTELNFDLKYSSLEAILRSSLK